MEASVDQAPLGCQAGYNNFVKLLALSRDPRKTAAVSSVPRKEQRVPFHPSGHASAAFALFFCVIGLMPALERPGNFTIRFEPTADLQTGAPIPFQITVTDADRKPLLNARVTLQIETTNHTHVKLLKAPAVDTRGNPGVYVAKPVFEVPGEWNVYVEVHRQNGRWDEMSARTIQYNVPQSAP